MPMAWAPTVGPGRLERRHRRLLGAGAALLPGAGELLVELVLAAEELAAGYAYVVEHDLGSVRGADAVLLVLLALAQTRSVRTDDEARLAAALQRRIDGGDDHVDVGDAAVGDPRLRAVEQPLVLGLVVDRPGAQARHVGAGVGLAHAEGAEGDLVGCAVTLRYPFADLLGRAVAGDPGGGETGPHDRHADPGVTPEQLLDGDRQRQAGRVEQGVGHEVHAVQADLGGLLDDRVGELLALVPLAAGGSDDGLGEVVDPLLDLQLVFVERCRELGHGSKLPRGNIACLPRVTVGGASRMRA